MSKLLISLNQSQINSISELTRTVEFKPGTTIIYADHIPQVAYILLEGEVVLRSKKGVITQKCPPGSLIAPSYFHLTKPLKVNVEVITRSKLLVVDKSLLKSLENQQPPNILDSLFNFAS